MSKERLRNIPGYKEFKNIARFFFCEEEYPGWTGTEKAAVISELSAEELLKKFPEIMKGRHDRADRNPTAENQ